MNEDSPDRSQHDAQPPNARKDRVAAAYFASTILAVAAVVGIVLLISGGDDESGSLSADSETDLAHVQLQSGSTNGLSPDGRDGPEPAESEGVELAEAAEAAGCELQEDLPEEGNEHLEPGGEGPSYGTRPATSGDHSLDPQADGAYLDPVPAVNVVHSLEHGRVAFHYAPGLADASQLELKGTFEEDPDGMLLFPDPEMPYEVAASAWTALIGCETYRGEATVEALRAFRDEYRGQGPEQVPISL